MKLPDSAIGISDILGYLECPMRFEFGMRRHSGKAPAESWTYPNAYGSCVHHGIHVLDMTGDIDQAVTEAFREFKQWLEPDDLQLLRDDLEVYLVREPVGYKMVMSEAEIRVPLFVHPTEGRVFFRARIDKLYVREDNDSLFLMRDYKSSRWPKSEEEVHKDPQMWSYNFALHEYIPEMEDLAQEYDQLRFGIIPTHKDANQRGRMKAWLIEAVNAIIADETLAPTFNSFCSWCPLLYDCPEISSGLTDFALARIAALAPREPKIKQDGTPGKRLGPPQLDPERFSDYTEVLPRVDKARRTLEVFSDTVKSTLKEMPAERREQLGYTLREKQLRGLSADGKRRVFEAIGDDFFHIADLSRAAAERYYGKGAEELTIIDSFLERSGSITELIAVASNA